MRDDITPGFVFIAIFTIAGILGSAYWMVTELITDMWWMKLWAFYGLVDILCNVVKGFGRAFTERM